MHSSRSTTAKREKIDKPLSDHTEKTDRFNGQTLVREGSYGVTSLRSIIGAKKVESVVAMDVMNYFVDAKKGVNEQQR
jgi:hypothetical protein